MSDTLRVHRAVRQALDQLYPTLPTGRTAQTLETLAWFITGVVKSGKSQLPAVASQMPLAQRESRIKRLSRFTQNPRVEERVSFLFFAGALLRGLAHLRKRLVLVIDGSEIGRGCRVLVVSVVYGSRALPIGFFVTEGVKGHFSEAEHLRLLQAVQPWVPEGVAVTFVGDGEFDGVDLLAQLDAWQWEYVCRSAPNVRLFADGESFAFRAITPLRGDCFSVSEALFTKQRYGPLLALALWKVEERDPIYLVSNLELPQEACFWYRKRFRIETFFSDQKSRGFHLHKSHLSDPGRLARLMIACCLAYWWIVFLGKTAMQPQWRRVLHRTSRCDLSLFQLGKILLQHLLNLSLPIPVCFLSPPPCPVKSVRY
jgi:hypothetical protein